MKDIEDYFLGGLAGLIIGFIVGGIFVAGLFVIGRF